MLWRSCTHPQRGGVSPLAHMLRLVLMLLLALVLSATAYDPDGHLCGLNHAGAQCKCIVEGRGTFCNEKIGQCGDLQYARHQRNESYGCNPKWQGVRTIAEYLNLPIYKVHGQDMVQRHHLQYKVPHSHANMTEEGRLDKLVLHPSYFNEWVDLDIITGRSKRVTRPTKIHWRYDAQWPTRAHNKYLSTWGCQTNCKLTDNKDDADVLISSMLPSTKINSRQLTLSFSHEPMSYHQNRGAHMERFDLTMDLSPLSNIPHTNVPLNFWQRVHALPVPTLKQLERRKLAVWYASNCHETDWPRTMYVQELAQYMPIDLPGRCLHNVEGSSRASFESNSNLYSDYLFVIGFHNGLDNRNVDEKFFQAFLGNSVNVVMANDIVYYFAPGSHSFIDASRFASPRALASRLLYLRDNPGQYLQYFAYRTRQQVHDSTPPFQAALEETSFYNLSGTLCRVCACVEDPMCLRRRHMTPRGYLPVQRSHTMPG